MMKDDDDEIVKIQEAIEHLRKNVEKYLIRRTTRMKKKKKNKKKNDCDHDDDINEYNDNDDDDDNDDDEMNSSTKISNSIEHILNHMKYCLKYLRLQQHTLRTGIDCFQYHVWPTFIQNWKKNNNNNKNNTTTTTSTKTIKNKKMVVDQQQQQQRQQKKDIFVTNTCTSTTTNTTTTTTSSTTAVLLHDDFVADMKHIFEQFLRLHDGLILCVSGECRHIGDIKMASSIAKKAKRSSNHKLGHTNVDGYYPSMLNSSSSSSNDNCNNENILRNDGYTQLYKNKTVDGRKVYYTGTAWDEWMDQYNGLQTRLIHAILEHINNNNNNKNNNIIVSRSSRSSSTIIDRIWSTLLEKTPMLEQILNEIENNNITMKDDLRNLYAGNSTSSSSRSSKSNNNGPLVVDLKRLLLLEQQQQQQYQGSSSWPLSSLSNIQVHLSMADKMEKWSIVGGGGATTVGSCSRKQRHNNTTTTNSTTNTTTTTLLRLERYGNHFQIQDPNGVLPIHICKTVHDWQRIMMMMMKLPSSTSNFNDKERTNKHTKKQSSSSLQQQRRHVLLDSDDDQENEKDQNIYHDNKDHNDDNDVDNDVDDNDSKKEDKNKQQNKNHELHMINNNATRTINDTTVVNDENKRTITSGKENDAGSTSAALSRVPHNKEKVSVSSATTTTTTGLVVIQGKDNNKVAASKKQHNHASSSMSQPSPPSSSLSLRQIKKSFGVDVDQLSAAREVLEAEEARAARAAATIDNDLQQQQQQHQLMEDQQYQHQSFFLGSGSGYDDNDDRYCNDDEDNDEEQQQQQRICLQNAMNELRRSKRSLKRALLKDIPNDYEIWDARERLRISSITIGNEYLWYNNNNDNDDHVVNTTNKNKNNTAIMIPQCRYDALTKAIHYFQQSTKLVHTQQELNNKIATAERKIVGASSTSTTRLAGSDDIHIDIVDTRIYGQELLLQLAQSHVNTGIAIIELCRCDGNHRQYNNNNKYRNNKNKSHNSNNNNKNNYFNYDDAIQELDYSIQYAIEMRNNATKQQQQQQKHTGTNETSSASSSLLEHTLDIWKSIQVKSLALRWKGTALWYQNRRKQAYENFVLASSYCDSLDCDITAIATTISLLRVDEEEEILGIEMNIRSECYDSYMTLANLGLRALDDETNRESIRTNPNQFDKQLEQISIAIENAAKHSHNIQERCNMTSRNFHGLRIKFGIMKKDDLLRERDEIIALWKHKKESMLQRLGNSINGNGNINNNIARQQQQRHPRSDVAFSSNTLTGRFDDDHNDDTIQPTTKRYFVLANESQRRRRRQSTSKAMAASGYSNIGNSIRLSEIDDVEHGNEATTTSNGSSRQQQQQQPKIKLYRKWGDELLPQRIINNNNDGGRNNGIKSVPILSYPSIAPVMPPEIRAAISSTTR